MSDNTPTPADTPVPTPETIPTPEAHTVTIPRPRPEFLKGSAIGASVIVSGVAFVTVLVLSVIATLLLGLSLLDHGLTDATTQAGIPTSTLSQNPGSVSVLPVFLLIGSLALLGNVSASLSGSGAELSATLTITPLALTLLIAFITAWAGYAVERRSATRTRSGLLLLSLASGLALAVVWTLLVALVRPGVQVQGVDLSLTGGTVRTFFGALVLVSSATLLGRWVARRGPAPIARFPRELAARMSATPRIVADAWSVLLVGGVIFGAVSLIGGIISIGTQIGWGTAFGGLLIWWGPAAFFSSVIGQFGAIWALAIGSSGASSTNSSTFVSLLDNGFFWILVLAAVVTAIIAGLRISRRRGWAERRSLATAWRLPVLAAASWLVLPWIFGVLAASGSGNIPLVGDGSLSALVTVAPWFFLIGGVWGVAVEAFARFAAPLLVSTYPAARRVSGPRASTLDSPEPLSAAHRRGLGIGLGAAAAVIVVVAIGGIGISILSTSVFGPSATVNTYLGQIVSGDLTAANRTVKLTATDGTALTDDKVLPAADRITSARVDKVEVSGRQATATVSFALAGKRHTAQLELQSSGQKFLVFQDWRLITPLSSSIDIGVDGANQAAVNGVPVKLKDGSATVDVYPGRYTVTLPGSNKWFSAKPQTVVAAHGYATAQLDAKPTAALTDEVTRQTKTLIDGCVAQGVPAPTGCPFEEYTFGDVSGFHWTVKSYPDVTVSDDGQSFDLSGGDILAEYSESYYGFTDAQSNDNDVYAFGTITISGNTVTLKFDS